MASDLLFLRQYPAEYRQIAGVRMHVLKEGSGPPLVLIHGGGTWMWTWRLQLAELSRYFTVYALDMPGFGLTTSAQSFAPTEDYFAGVVHAFFDAMGISRATIVGSSWGGGWALRFAELHPERVDKLVLIGTAGLFYHNLRRPTAIWNLVTYPVIGRFLALHAVTPGLLRQQYASLFVDRSKIPQDAGEALFAGLQTQSSRRTLYEYGYRDMWAKTDADLETVRSRALLIWGERDPMFPLTDAHTLQQRLPNAKLVVLPGVGHLPHEEAPEKTNALIMQCMGISHAEKD